MEKITLPKLDVTIYKYIVENGLSIYIIPKDKGNNVYATFTAKYGSKTNGFIPSNQTEMVEVEDGIAHFLEHKVFEQEVREEPFAFFGKRGADANASTSYDKTSYIFSGSSHIQENISYLLDFVQDPYLTEENVEKEKGIIKEELLMYQDNPYSLISEKSIYNSFHKNPVRKPIGGTVQSIMKITKDMLEMCYQTFYHPSNMFLVISGNVDPENIIDIVKTNQEQKTFPAPQEIQYKEYKEPDTVYQKEETIYKDVVIPKVSVTFKINYTKIKKYSPFSIRLALFMFFNSKFGATSTFTEKLKQDKIISENSNIDMVGTEKHFLFLISGDSNDPKEFSKRIKEEMNNLIIEEDEIERKKKVLLSTTIYASDSIYALNSKVISHVIRYGEILDDYERIKNFTSKDFFAIIKSIDFSHSSTVIIDKAP